MSSQYGAEPVIVYEMALPPSELVPKKLCSVVPWDLSITHWSMQGSLPGARDGQFGFITVGPGVSKRDLGNNNHVAIVNIPPRAMALDLMGLDARRCDGRNVPEAGHTSNWWAMGVFVPAGMEPSEEELAAAKDRLHAWARTMVLHGDTEYSQYKTAAAVSSLAKKAAQILRIEREWSQDLTANSQFIDCPCCKNRIHPGARKCTECGELLAYDKGGKVYWVDDPARQASSKVT